MNELVTITEFKKLRQRFLKETGMYAIKHKKEYTHWLEQELVNNINYNQCCTELPTIEDANSEMYKVSNNLKTDHKQTEVNYYESGFRTCFNWLSKRKTK